MRDLCGSSCLRLAAQVKKLLRCVVQIAKAPEARAMLAALAASATAEGVRAAMFGMRDLVFAPAPASAPGGPEAGGAAAAWQQAHPLCRGYMLGCLTLLLVLYLTARHGAVQLAAPMPIGL